LDKLKVEVMCIIKLLRKVSILPDYPVSKKKLQERKKNGNKKIVAMLSEGNILFQQGKFLTQEQTDLARKKILRYKF
jgi:hypothetical protein